MKKETGKAKERRRIARSNGRWIFLSTVLFIYLIMSLFNFSLAQEVFLVFGKLLLQILPVLATVFILLFVSKLFLSPRRVVRILGASSGYKGWIFMIIGGILSAGPIYLWYPLLRDLRQKGTRDALIIAFLNSRAVKAPFLPIMIYYFGFSFVLILTIYMILFSVINGLVVEKFLTKNKKPDDLSLSI